MVLPSVVRCLIFETLLGVMETEGNNSASQY